MSTPNLTSAERLEALRRAAECRKIRARFKAEIAAGKYTAKQALDKALGDAVLSRITVDQFIRAFPGYGPVKAASILEKIQAAKNRRIKGLGRIQREALVDILDS